MASRSVGIPLLHESRVLTSRELDWIALSREYTLFLPVWKVVSHFQRPTFPIQLDDADAPTGCWRRAAPN
jgi:hypothetical protein